MPRKATSLFYATSALIAIESAILSQQSALTVSALALQQATDDEQNNVYSIYGPYGDYDLPDDHADDGDAMDGGMDGGDDMGGDDGDMMDDYIPGEKEKRPRMVFSVSWDDFEREHGTQRKYTDMITFRPHMERPYANVSPI